MMQHPHTPDDGIEVQLPLEGLSPWQRFKIAFRSEVTWKPQRRASDLAILIVTGVPALWVVNFIVASIAKSAGVEAGTDRGPIMDMIRETPGLLLLLGVVVAPLLEEFFFRVIPRAIGKARRPTANRMWTLGVLCTVLFALAHINPDNPTFPLPQFFTGLALWATQVRFGYLGSITLHACFNASLIIPAILYVQHAT